MAISLLANPRWASLILCIILGITHDDTKAEDITVGVFLLADPPGCVDCPADCFRQATLDTAVVDDNVKDFIAQCQKRKINVSCIGLGANVHLSHDGWKLLSEINTLKKLYLNNLYVDSKALNAIVTIQSLELLELNYSTITDDDLVLLKQLQHLGSLSLAHTKISDRGLKTLSELKQLTKIDLSGVRNITAEGLMALNPLPKLETLNLYGYRLGEQLGVKAGESISGFKHLRNLNIGSNAPEGAVDSAVIVMLEALQHLEYLDLVYIKISNEALKTIGTFTLLKGLDLSFVDEIDDSNVAYLKKLTALRRLNLRGTQITLRGLMKLRKVLSSLRYLNIDGTDISKEDVKKIVNINPKIEIHADPLGG